MTTKHKGVRKILNPIDKILDGEPVTRRQVLAGTATGMAGMAGCGTTAEEETSSQDTTVSKTTNNTTTTTEPTPNQTETKTETTEDTPTKTEEPTETTEDTPTKTEEPTETPESETIYPSDTRADAQEEYRSMIEAKANHRDLDFDIDTSQPYREQIKEAALKGAKEGELGLNPKGGMMAGDTHIAAAAAIVENIDDFNFNDGDIAAPHRVYAAGQQPGVIIEYTDPETGKQHADLITPQAWQTHEEHYHKNWTQESTFWDDSTTNSHILDADIFEKSFEHTPPGEWESQEGTKEDFSMLPYNSNQSGVAKMIPHSWEAWFKAEEKVTEGNAKEVLDDLTELANDPENYAFAFGYDEEADSFTSEVRMDKFEYEDVNPFKYLEWPREE